MPTKDEEATTLAQIHYDLEEGMLQIFRVKGPDDAEERPSEPIKLLEVTELTVPSGILPLQFGPSPAASLIYSCIIMEVTPEEFEKIRAGDLKLPHGWVVGDPHPQGARRARSLSEPGAWARALARQADADFRAWELYEKHPEAVAAECHKLLFLQMACEKLCKAYLIRRGTNPGALQASHGYIANPLPIIIQRQILHVRGHLEGMRGVLSMIRQLAREIEALNPAMRRDGLRPDNCEYPWEAEGRILSPLDWSFQPSRFSTTPAGRSFLKLVRGALDRILSETTET